MLKYIDKKTLKSYKNFSLKSVEKACAVIRKDCSCRVRVELVGSGKENLVIADEKGFDLDYNIILTRVPKKLMKSPQQLKEKIRLALNGVMSEHIVADGSDSSSVLSFTTNLTAPNGITFFIDCGIIVQKKDTFYRLLHDKKTNAYSFKPSKEFYQLHQMVRKIKYNHYINELQNEYLKLKNQKPKEHSYLIFSQAVNHIAMRHRDMQEPPEKVSSKTHKPSQLDQNANSKNPNKK